MRKAKTDILTRHLNSICCLFSTNIAYIWVTVPRTGKMSIIRPRLKKSNDALPYEQVSVSSGIGRTEGPKFEMPLKYLNSWLKYHIIHCLYFVHTQIYFFLFLSNFHVYSCFRPKMNFWKLHAIKKVYKIR